MGNKVRIPLGNFSMGELSPKLGGQPGLELYRKGATEMTNVIPQPLGGARKRGGLCRKLVLGTGTDKFRLIPWSVGKNIDVMLCLSDGSIRFINVSADSEPSFMEDDDGIINITTLRTGVSSYSSDDINEICYAQNLNEIILTHQDYPPFMITVSSGSNSSGDIVLSVEYGIPSFSGNVATSDPIEDSDVNGEMTLAQILDATTGLVSGNDSKTIYPDYTASGNQSQIEVSGVTYAIYSYYINRTSKAQRITVSGTDIYASTDLLSSHVYSQGGDDGSENWMFRPNMYVGTGFSHKYYSLKQHTKLDHVIDACTASKTMTVAAFMALCAANLNPGSKYQCFGTGGWWVSAGTYPSKSLYYYGATVKYDCVLKYGVAVTGLEYVASGTTLTVTETGNSRTVGTKLRIGADSSGTLPAGEYTIATKSTNSWTATLSSSLTESGTCVVITNISQIGLGTGIDASYTGQFHYDAEDITINGYGSSMADLLNKLSPWMLKNRTYPCSSAYSLSGHTITSAIRLDDSTAGPVIQFNYTDSSGSPQTIIASRSSTNISGRVGVIVTPFYDSEEYPSCATYYGGRLVMAGSKKDPNCVWMSKTNDHTNFCYFEEVEYQNTELKPASEWAEATEPETTTTTALSQEVEADSAIVLQVATDENENICTMATKDDLFIGTSTSEWIFQAGLTALNPRVSMISRHGCANVQSKFIGNGISFLNNSQTRLRVLSPEGTDLMKYADHVAKSGITCFDFREDPDTEIFAALENGNALVAISADNSYGWARIVTDGSGIESTTAIRASDEDAVYFVVKRTINGTVNHVLERLVTNDDESFAGRMYLDGFVYTDAAGTSLSVPAYANTTLSVRFCDGNDEYSGSVTLDSAGAATTYTPDDETVAVAVPAFTEAVVGYAYDSALETFRIDDESTEGFVKMAEMLHLRCLNTGVFHIEAPNGTLYDVRIPDTDDIVGYPFTGIIRHGNLDGWGTDKTVRFVSNNSEPFGLLMATASFDVSEGE